MIGFRVDANEQIATGHLMRCMAIAKGFQRRGEEVVFFLAEEKETERLEAQNLPYVVLHSQWNDLAQELPVLEKKLKEHGVTRLIVDSYLAVSAGGTTLYELCACKVPTISFSFADNQEGFTEEMGEQGILFYAGDARKEESLIEIIYNKLADLWMEKA